MVKQQEYQNMTQIAFAAVDAGATKSECILSTTGQTFTHKTVGVNLHNHLEHQVSNLQQIIKWFATQAQVHQLHIHCLCLAVAGLDTLVDSQKLKSIYSKAAESFPNLSQTRLVLVPDILALLYADQQQFPAIALVIGTGTNCIGITRDTYAQAGNRGYLCGDQGSGFWLGQRIIQESIKELDGRIDPTALSQQVLQFLHLHDVDQLTNAIYSHPDPVSYIASLTHLVSQLSDHPYINQLIQNAVKEIGMSVAAVHDKLNTQQPVPVYVGGGLTHIASFYHPLIQHLTHILPNQKIHKVSHAPVTGALHIARSQWTISNSILSSVPQVLSW